MRILYVTQTFHPEPLSTERFVRQAAALQRLGHDVTVLTTMPFYPAGRVFPGYRGRLFMRETHEGLPIVRVWSFPAPNRGTLRRALSYVSFAILAALVAIFLTRRDLIIAAVPNPGAEFAGIVASRVRGSMLLLEMVDLVPENLAFIGMREASPLYRVLRRYYAWAYRRADAIGVLCDAAADVLKSKGVEASRIILMPNAADPDLLASTPADEVRSRHGLGNAFVVVYAGSFSGYYAVENIIAAARLLRDASPAVRFVLLGEGSRWEAVRDTIVRENLTNVTLPGVVPRAELGGYLHTADAFIMSMVAPQTPQPYHGILTAKACDYLLVGRPILAIEDGRILAPLLEDIGAGVRVPPEDPAALARTIAAYANDPARCRAEGERAASYARTHLRRDHVVAGFERVLRERLHQRHARRAETQRTAPDGAEGRHA